MQNVFQTNFNINTIRDISKQKNIKNGLQNSNISFEDTLQSENKTKNKKKKSVIIGSMVFLGILGAAFVLHNKKTVKKIKKPAGENISSAAEAIEEIIPEKIKTIKKLTEDIFLEDFSTDEAVKIQEKYKQIAEIKDRDKLLNKLFAELKKDYHLQNIPVQFDKNFNSQIQKFQNETTARTIGLHTGTTSYKEFLDKLNRENSELLNDLEPVDGNNMLMSIKPESKLEEEILKTFGKIKHEIKIATDLDTASIIETLTHEFRHEKQFLLQYQASTKDELEAAQTNIWKNRMKQIKTRVENNTANKEDAKTFSTFEKTMKKIGCSYEELLDIYAPYDRINRINTKLNMQNRYYYYKDLGIKHINENHKNYVFGRKVLESERLRDTDSSFENYKNRFIEIDAREAGANMLKLINL